MRVAPIGRRRWAFTGGPIPVSGQGPEPLFTPHDRLSLLNAGDGVAHVRITLLHADREPVGPYPLSVAPRRVRQLRLNDLIDPQAIPLEQAYAALVESDVPVVVQFGRQDTRRRALALLGTVAFAGDEEGGATASARAPAAGSLRSSG